MYNGEKKERMEGEEQVRCKWAKDKQEWLVPSFISTVENAAGD